MVGGKSTSEEVDATLIPCGTCLQYILDMCKDIDIIMYMDKKLVELKASDLLKVPFILENHN